MALGFPSSALLVMAVVFCVIVGARAADTDCSAALASVGGCVSFLTNPSSTPDQKTCCQPLQTVLTTPASFQCLCAQANSQAAAAKNALLLPKACKLDINVSASNCTTSSTTPSTTPATTTPTPAAGNATTLAGSGSGGFLGAAPYSPFVAMALLCAIATLLL